ncbi:hypothetical protein VCHA53O463_220066 [Vibrio chagasii]|nr:hypothetical protein VCHA56P515_220025 [Vibrio chagasii]CAH7166312.1 hypothetical protein VCHA53O463_220066 [Vibrio chagasii]
MIVLIVMIEYGEFWESSLELMPYSWYYLIQKRSYYQSRSEFKHGRLGLVKTIK